MPEEAASIQDVLDLTYLDDEYCTTPSPHASLSQLLSLMT